jgi:hypothetical protein
MKKYAVLLLLPLAAALFAGFPAELSAEGNSEKDKNTRPQIAPDLKSSGNPAAWEDEKSAIMPVTVNSARSGTANSTASSMVNSTVSDTANSLSPVKVPAWVTDLSLLETDYNINPDNEFVGIGSGKNDEDPLQAIRMAETRARQDIASQQGTSGQQTADTESFPVTVVAREWLPDDPQKPAGPGTWWVILTTLKGQDPKTTTPGIVVESTSAKNAMERAVKGLEHSLQLNKPERR